MRKYFGVIAALLLLAAPMYAQDVQQTIPLAQAFDLDGEAADADQIVTLANGVITDAKTYTITASPDVCRPITFTLVDTDMTAGTFTVVGTDCWGDALTCTLSPYTAGDDSGVHTPTVSSGSSATCSFATVTSITNGTMTGESDETITVGYTANSGLGYPIYGIRETLDGLRWVNPFRRNRAPDITVNGTAVASDDTAEVGAFQNLAVGDLVYITYNGRTFERKLTTVTDDNNAVINAAIPSAVAPGTTTQVRMEYKKFFYLVEPTDAWIPVGGATSANFQFDVDANANTGGVVSSIECASYVMGEFNPLVVLDTDTVNSAATGSVVSQIDNHSVPYPYCRAGIKFGTGDDGDTANEDINLTLLIVKGGN